MDARSRRTRDSLVSAAYALAEKQDIASISVTDITRASGISRDTFYRHASDPVDLVATALLAEISESISQFGDLLAPADDENEHVFAKPTRVFLCHVRDHATLYRMAVSGRLSGRLRGVLVESARGLLTEHLRRHPQIVPPELQPLDETAFAMAVAYAAGGTVAAAESWLISGDLGDVERAVQIILSASPQWWGDRK